LNCHGNSTFALLIQSILSSPYMPQQCKQKVKGYCDQQRFTYDSERERSVTLDRIYRNRIVLAADCSMDPRRRTKQG